MEQDPKSRNVSSLDAHRERKAQEAEEDARNEARSRLMHPAGKGRGWTPSGERTSPDERRKEPNPGLSKEALRVTLEKLDLTSPDDETK